MALGILACLTSIARAKVVLPTVIGNGMVLQQQSDVKLWGNSKGKLVKIITSWNKKEYTAEVNAQGKWTVKVTTPKAGGPYQITFNDGEETQLSNILIGEVWLVSGQSNMEMPIKGFKTMPVLNSAEFLKNASHPNIRLFRVARDAKGEPAENLRGRWQISDSTSVKLFSAVGYLYALELQRKLNVPIGIIQSAWGGTGIESWMSKETLTPFDKYPVKPAAEVTEKDRLAPSALFNGMISPLIGYGIKGVLWYQGEHNHREPELYAKMFPKMIGDWRAKWGLGDFPFYYVQLAPIEAIKDGEDISLSALFREMQLNSQFVIPNAAMSVTLDIGEQKIIHPSNKQEVAKRLAAIAFNQTYGFKDIPFNGPLYRSMEIKADQLILSFDHAEKGLTSTYKKLVNFEIAGKDRVFYPAEGKIIGNKVMLTSAKIKNPLAARYGFKPWVKGDLFNAEGLPASSFRTDDWFSKQLGK